jgi:hypothetical protein
MLAGGLIQSGLICPITRRARPVRTGPLIDGAAIYWDLRAMSYAEVTLTGNRTLYALHVKPAMKGATFVLKVTQDGTGSRTLAYDTPFKWAGGSGPVLSIAAGAIDVLTFICDGTNLYGVCQKAFT